MGDGLLRSFWQRVLLRLGTRNNIRSKEVVFLVAINSTSIVQLCSLLLSIFIKLKLALFGDRPGGHAKGQDGR